jgi:hypothetical protein
MCIYHLFYVAIDLRTKPRLRTVLPLPNNQENVLQGSSSCFKGQEHGPFFASPEEAAPPLSSSLFTPLELPNPGFHAERPFCLFHLQVARAPVAAFTGDLAL